MTIGKNSRKSSARSSIRAPKFLDKSNGFYGRLDEPEAAAGEEEVKGNHVGERWSGMEDSDREGTVMSSPSPQAVHVSGADEEGEVEVFHLNEGMMEDDGETLLQRKHSRRSSRWRRSSRRKNEGRAEEEAGRDERADLGSETPGDPQGLKDARLVSDVEMDKEEEKGGRPKEPTLVHFPIRGDADDQVLIRDQKRGRKEEGKQEEEKKMVKRSTVKNYHKALNRALRRGWETFITNLYSVTLTPVTSASPPSSSPSLKKKQQHSSILAEFQ